MTRIYASFWEIGLYIAAFAPPYERLESDTHFCEAVKDHRIRGSSETPMETADWLDVCIQQAAIGGVS